VRGVAHVVLYSPYGVFVIAAGLIIGLIIEYSKEIYYKKPAGHFGVVPHIIKRGT